MGGRIAGLMVGAAAVLVVVGVAWWFSLERSVAQAIEREGRRVFGTEVTVGSVDLSLSSGRGTLRDLRVANPEGFSDADAFHLDEIELAINTQTLSVEPLRLDEVRVGEPLARLEIDAKGRSNLERLLHHARDVPPEPPRQGEAPREGEPPEEVQRFAIDRLSFVGGEILLARPGEDLQSIDLPAFESRELADDAGFTGSQIGQRVIVLVARRMAVATARDELGRVAEQLGDEIGEAARSVIDQLFD